jgi:hypothetical protein
VGGAAQAFFGLVPVGGQLCRRWSYMAKSGFQAFVVSKT